MFGAALSLAWKILSFLFVCVHDFVRLLLRFQLHPPLCATKALNVLSLASKPPVLHPTHNFLLLQSTLSAFATAPELTRTLEEEVEDSRSTESLSLPVPVTEVLAVMF